MPIAAALVLVSACERSAGPAYLRIETGGERYDDFVIEPVQEYGRLHGSKMVVMPTRVVASETDLTLPAFRAGWTFTTLLVSAYHPEFLYTWTGKADSSSRELTLSPLRPRRWSDLLAEHREVSLMRVADHLQHLLGTYVPAFETGEPRSRLRSYLPGLRELVERGTWQPGDSRRWSDETEARAELDEMIRRISELMR